MLLQNPEFVSLMWRFKITHCLHIMCIGNWVQDKTINTETHSYLPQTSGSYGVDDGDDFLVTVPSCRLVRRYQRFGEIYCLHLQGLNIFWRQYVTRSDGVYLRVYRTSQRKNTIGIHIYLFILFYLIADATCFPHRRTLRFNIRSWEAHINVNTVFAKNCPSCRLDMKWEKLQILIHHNDQAPLLKPFACCDNPLTVNDVPRLEIPLASSSPFILLVHTSPSQHRNALNPKEPKKKSEKGNKKHTRWR
jgi:hypothetical protein